MRSRRVATQAVAVDVAAGALAPGVGHFGEASVGFVGAGGQGGLLAEFDRLDAGGAAAVGGSELGDEPVGFALDGLCPLRELSD